ncbi:hypothetical protein ZWY2020_048439 [Hordeum vulgare]|nr:hypothetical protein ZWY2020_048439 [Hordeum vulgare]
MSTHERKASIKEFYAVIFPSLVQLQRGITDMEDKKQKAVCMERYRRRDEDETSSLSDVDAEREGECGICMEMNNKVVLPNCTHAMCLRCYQDCAGCVRVGESSTSREDTSATHATGRLLFSAAIAEHGSAETRTTLLASFAMDSGGNKSGGAAGEDGACSGGHLCHLCGYRSTRAHPSAKQRRAHCKNCGGGGKSPPAAASAEGEEERQGKKLVPGADVGGKANGAPASDSGGVLPGSAEDVGMRSADKLQNRRALKKGQAILADEVIQAVSSATEPAVDSLVAEVISAGSASDLQRKIPPSMDNIEEIKQTEETSAEDSTLKTSILQSASSVEEKEQIEEVMADPASDNIDLISSRDIIVQRNRVLSTWELLMR